MCQQGSSSHSCSENTARLGELHPLSWCTEAPFSGALFLVFLLRDTPGISGDPCLFRFTVGAFMTEQFGSFGEASRRQPRLLGFSHL